MFKAIAAMSENRVIGSQGRIPWHLPEDFRWFKKMTLGKTVVMGRKTFESLGKPLPNRLNIILTRNPKLLSGSKDMPPIYAAAKWGNEANALLRRAANPQLPIPVTRNTELALLPDFSRFFRSEFHTEVWIIGGANTYSQTLEHCSDLYLTRVKLVVDGDAFFPPFEDRFERVGTLLENAEFVVEHYRQHSALPV